MVFFYTCGAYQELTQNEFYFRRASGVDDDQTLSATSLNAVSMRLTNGKFGLFKVLEVSHIRAKKLVPGDELGAQYNIVLLLSDGRDIFEASVDTSLNHLISQQPQSFKSNSNLLVNGSAVLITQFALVSSPSDPKIHLIELMVVGHDDTWTEQEALTVLAMLECEEDMHTPVQSTQNAKKKEEPQTSEPESAEQREQGSAVNEVDDESTDEEMHLALELTQKPATKRKRHELDDDDEEQEATQQANDAKRTQLDIKDQQQQQPSQAIHEHEQVEQKQQESEITPQSEHKHSGLEIQEPWPEEKTNSRADSAPKTYRLPPVEVPEGKGKHATHTLNQLTNKMSNTYWSFKARLTNISPVNEFEKRTDGKRNCFRRLQFQDATGVMEAVIFGSMCMSPKIEELEMHKCYQVTFGTFSFSKQLYRFWHSDYNTAFDLTVTPQTQLRLLDEDEADEISGICFNATHELTTAASRSSSTNMKPDDATAVASESAASNSRSSDGAAKLGPGGFPLKYPNCYKLNKLLLMAPKSTCNVIAIVYKVGELPETDGKATKKIKVRRVTIIDETNVPIEVAFWGLEAEVFDYPVGAILFFRDIEVTNYKGLSLSVTRNTKYVEFKATDDPNIDISMNLRKWWQANAKQMANKDDGQDIIDAMFKRPRGEDDDKSDSAAKRSK